MTLVLRYAARSDRGLIRGNNQDSVYAGPRLLAVADGMGGHAPGPAAEQIGPHHPERGEDEQPQQQEEAEAEDLQDDLGGHGAVAARRVAELRRTVAGGLTRRPAGRPVPSARCG